VAQRFKVDQIGCNLREEDSGFPGLQWRNVFSESWIRGWWRGLRATVRLGMGGVLRT